MYTCIPRPKNIKRPRFRNAVQSLKSNFEKQDKIDHVVTNTNTNIESNCKNNNDGDQDRVLQNDSIFVVALQMQLNDGMLDDR